MEPNVRTIIAGSRTCTSMKVLHQALIQCDWEPSVVLCGGAAGADALGQAWSARVGVPCEMYPADWKKHGRAAGPIRNLEMARKAEALIALWDGESRGTAHMIKTAQKLGLRVYVHRFTPLPKVLRQSSSMRTLYED